MSDYISRQEAIEEIEEEIAKCEEWRDNCEPEKHYLAEQILYVLKMVRVRFENMPSEQPEFPFEIQDILDYLDTALHPIISPELWNVYSELHDMISTLPFAQPDRKKGKWIPHSETCREYIGTVLVRVDYDYWFCDACGYRVEKGQPMYKFCPNCGADMRGEQS